MMVANEITIKLDDSFTAQVCDYSVGFLRFGMDGRFEIAEPVGTGTFVKLGRVYGIMTAAHVLTSLDFKSMIGLVRFPSVNPALQNRRLNLQYTENILDWNKKEGDAPDIGFLKIPEQDGRAIEATGAIFYNLETIREFAAGNPHNSMCTCHAVVGVVAEWTEKVNADIKVGSKINVGGLFCAAKNPRFLSEGNAAITEVEVDHANGLRIPTSYGGVSGGALWKLFVEVDAKHMPVRVNKRLVGVAFRQSDD